MSSGYITPEEAREIVAAAKKRGLISDSATMTLPAHQNLVKPIVDGLKAPSDVPLYRSKHHIMCRWCGHFKRSYGKCARCGRFSSREKAK